MPNPRRSQQPDRRICSTTARRRMVEGTYGARSASIYFQPARCASLNSHHSHLTDTLRHCPDHGTRQQVSQEHCRRSSRSQTRARAKPKTHADGRTKSNHGDVSGAEPSLQLRLGAMVINKADFAMALVLLITAVAIEGFLCRVLRDLLDASVGHGDGVWIKRRDREISALNGKCSRAGSCATRSTLYPPKPRPLSIHQRFLKRQVGTTKPQGSKLVCLVTPKAPSDRHAGLIGRDSC